MTQNTCRWTDLTDATKPASCNVGEYAAKLDLKSSNDNEHVRLYCCQGSATTTLDIVSATTKSTDCGLWDAKKPVANKLAEVNYKLSGTTEVHLMEYWRGSLVSGDKYECHAWYDRVTEEYVCKSICKIGTGCQARAGFSECSGEWIGIGSA